MFWVFLLLFNPNKKLNPNISILTGIVHYLEMMQLSLTPGLMITHDIALSCRNQSLHHFQLQTLGRSCRHSFCLHWSEAIQTAFLPNNGAVLMNHLQCPKRIQIFLASKHFLPPNCGNSSCGHDKTASYNLKSQPLLTIVSFHF